MILGSLPIVVVGLAFKEEIETTLRSLWFVGGALILWSGVMWFADSRATQRRHESDVTWRDTLIIGIVQCLALIPGVSRSGATMSAGLLREIDRVAVTRLSFFLSIPALTGAGILQAVNEFDNIAGGVGWGPTIVATLVSFAVAFVAVTWLLRYIARHDLLRSSSSTGSRSAPSCWRWWRAARLRRSDRSPRRNANGPGQAGRLRRERSLVRLILPPAGSLSVNIPISPDELRRSFPQITDFHL